MSTLLCFMMLAMLLPVDCRQPVNTTELSISSTTVVTNNSTTMSTISVIDFGKEMEKIASAATKMVLPYLVRNSDLKLSTKCMSTIIKIFTDVRKLKAPALKLLDSMAKPPPGLLTGSFAAMGDYEECLSISVTKKGDFAKNPEDEHYHGHYCTVEVNLPESVLNALQDYGKGRINLTDFGKIASIVEQFPTTNFAGDYYRYHVGLCLPSTCTKDDLVEMVKSVPITFLDMNVRRCEDNRDKGVTVDQAIILAILCLIAVLVLTGTCLDGYFYVRYSTYNGNHKGKFIQFLLSFSAYRNTKILLSKDKDPSGDVSCINGMYATGTFLVIVYHTYLLPFYTYFSRNAANLGHFMNDVHFTLVSTMSISIEAYFLFSGLFLVYARFRRSSGKTAQVNVIKLLIRRYMRLGPSMMLTVAFILILPIIGSGPVWEDIFQVAAENAKKWWYTYVLMYNNFLEIKDLSFLYFWFIPALMQITIPGAILTWILAKSRKLGIALIILTAIGCNIALAVLTIIRKYPPSYAIYFFYNREHYELMIYTGPLSHVSSFCIGMLLGYYMSTGPVIKWSKVKTVIGWLACVFLTVGVQYLLFPFHDGNDVNVTFSAIYGSLHKPAFALGMVWLILACTYGYGGVLAKILCWKGFGPLSKLGYLAYLVHYLVIAFHGSFARAPMQFSHYEVWIRIFSYTSITYVVAYVLYVCFEVPLTYVESLFLPTRPENESEASPIHKISNISTDNGKLNGIVITPDGVNAMWNINNSNGDPSKPHIVYNGEQSRL